MYSTSVCVWADFDLLGEFADHAVPRPVADLHSVLVVLDQPQLVVDAELFADLGRQVGAVALEALVARVLHAVLRLAPHQIRLTLMHARTASLRRTGNESGPKITINNAINLFF